MLRQWGTVIVPYSYFNEMDMKVTVIMEKASDGYYSCFVEEDLPDFGLAGYGDTAEAAKEDMMKAYEEIKEMQVEEGKEEVKPLVFDLENSRDRVIRLTVNSSRVASAVFRRLHGPGIGSRVFGTECSGNRVT